MGAAIRNGPAFFAVILGTAIGFGLAVLIFGATALASLVIVVSFLAAIPLVMTA